MFLWQVTEIKSENPKIEIKNKWKLIKMRKTKKWLKMKTDLYNYYII